MRPEPQRLVDRREFPILYVDDEKENLRAFELAFRREYCIETATSGRAALELINSLPIAVVLSDHKMPEMTGTEFLSRVRSVDPRTVRLLVTAYGDAETLSDAINNGAIYRYIAKPWTPQEMRQALGQAVDLYALESERESLLSEMTALRSVSHDLASELDRERLGHLVVRTVVEDLGFDGATLLAWSEGCLVSLGSCPEEGAAYRFLSDLRFDGINDRSRLAAAIAGRTQLITPDLELDDGEVVRRLVNEIAAEEILCVPLMSRQRAAGLLVVDNRRGGRRFLAAERALLEGLGSQVAVALENAAAFAAQRAESFAGTSTLAGPALLLGAGFRDVELLRSAVRELQREERKVHTLDLSEATIEAIRGLGVNARERVRIGSKLPEVTIEVERATLVVCLSLILAKALQVAGGEGVEIRGSEGGCVEVHFGASEHAPDIARTREVVVAATIWSGGDGSVQIGEGDDNRVCIRLLPEGDLGWKR